MSIRSSQPSRRSDRGNRVSGAAVVVLLLLLAMPVYALSRFVFGFDWRLLLAAQLVLSVITYFAYRSDKRRAESAEWRIPESMLHLWELLGGWPGAFLAQRKFRHKTSKISYQLTFWAVVAIHQYVALDSLWGWKLTKAILRLIRSQT